ncbi:MAG: type 1 glutamine amidotransferase domain-containing protein [Acidimicrobiales bacterium]
MAKVAIVLADGFEDVEFETPRTTLLEHGHEVTVVGTDEAKEVTGKQGRVTYTIDCSVDQVSASDFDALVIPGGYSPDRLRMDDKIVRFVKDCSDKGMPVAAICHAGSLLIEADLVKRRTVTSWPSIRTDLQNAGAAWMDQDVVYDGNLITSRKPDDLPKFMEAILEQLPAPEVPA